jgi:hypothetical protein
MKTTALALAALALVGCGSSRAEVLPVPKYFVDGVGVTVNTAEPWAVALNFQDRLHNTILASVRYAGGSLADLDGWYIVFQDGPIPCNSSTGTCSGTVHKPVITINAQRWGGCVENTVLAHEIAHVIIGDECHAAPLWDDLQFQSYADELNALPDTTCHVIGGYQTSFKTC